MDVSHGMDASATGYSIPDVVLSVGTTEILRWESFRVPQLHCHEEILLIEQLLSDCPGIVQLECDILQRRLDVRLQADQAVLDGLVERLSEAGMSALPWEEADPLVAESFWEQKSGAILALTSGSLLAIAALVHLVATLDRGLIGFFLESPSGFAQLLLAGSILSAFVKVVPRTVFALRHLRADMNILMLVAVLGAIAIDQWLEAATVAFLFSFALWLEQRTVRRARLAVKEVVQQTPRMARCVERQGSEARELPVQRVDLGQRVEVWPGERIPLDGVVLSGSTYVDQSAMTGESIPVAAEPGDLVHAGTMNVSSTILLEVTSSSDDTTLARTLRLVEQAQARRAPVQRWTESFARRYTPSVMALATAVMCLPPLLLPVFAASGLAWDASWDTWFYRGLVVLVISCPCALVISTPVAIIAGITTSVRRGILVKGGEFLEAMGNVGTIAFDKTGTLTEGAPRVEQLVPLGATDARELLGVAAALESTSHHPLAQAILDEARDQKIDIVSVSEFTVHHGEGIQGLLAGERVWIGKPSWASQQAELAREVRQTMEAVESAALTTLVVGRSDESIGIIGIADPLREDTAEVLRDLEKCGISQMLMLTGDGTHVAEAIAGQAGLDLFHGDLLPADKAERISQLDSRKGAVVMVGDGVNDSPAMASATVGIAMASMGSQQAIETADIALLANGLDRLPWLIRHARRTLKIIRQNTLAAIVLKVACLAASLVGLCSLWIAIAADTGATLLVTSNSLRLFRH